jgi:hypothetical protein
METFCNKYGSMLDWRSVTEAEVLMFIADEQCKPVRVVSLADIYYHLQSIVA